MHALAPNIMLLVFLALFIGGVLGYAFGLLQNVALNRSEKSPVDGQLQKGWMFHAGRFVCLLLGLVAVTVFFPALFQGNSPWWITAGVFAGYSIARIQQILRQRKAGSA